MPGLLPDVDPDGLLEFSVVYTDRALNHMSKRFVGAITGREAADRDVGTAATSVLLRLAGASIFRVHDVAINKDALAIADAMLAARYSFEQGQLA